MHKLQILFIGGRASTEDSVPALRELASKERLEDRWRNFLPSRLWLLWSILVRGVRMQELLPQQGQVDEDVLLERR